MAADYTRNIVFNVNDKAIKRATDRITRSLTNIEKTLQRIESKGFNNLAKEVDMTSKKINQASKSVNGFNILLRQTFGTGVGRRTLGLGILGGGIGINKAVDDLNNLKRTASTFLPVFGKSTAIATTKVSALSAALSKLGAFAAGDPLGAGALAVAYMIFGDKIQELALKAGGAAVGAFASLGKKAFEASTIGVAGFKQLNQEINITTQAALKMNTLFARQNAMRGNVVRNIGRSQAARRDSDFLGFSQDADLLRPQTLQSRISAQTLESRGFSDDQIRAAEQKFRRKIINQTVGRPAGFIGPDRPGIQDPVEKSIRRNQAKRDRLLQKELKIRQKILAVKKQNLVIDTKSEKIEKTKLNILQRGRRLLRNQFQEGGAFFNSRGRAGRIAGAAQSGLIGGGFPLLFGQSPGAAIAGGVGGALGGALSPGFGFAGSIVATAAAQKIGEAIEFRKEIEKLNKSIRLTGGDSEFTVASIKKLGKELGVSSQEALQAARSFEAFSASARISLTKVFGDEGAFNTLVNLRKTVDILNNIDLIEKKIGKKRADQAVDIATGAGGLQAQKFILEEIKKLQDEETKKDADKLSRQGFSITSFRAVLSDFNQILSGDPKFFKNIKNNPFLQKQRQDLFDANASAQAEADRKFNEEQRRIEARDLARKISQPRDELEELIDPLNQLISLSKSLGDSFSESFRGIVSGSITAQEALRNLFQRTANHFLDMAAQMIAKQIQMQILGIGLSFFSQGIAGQRGGSPTNKLGSGGTDRFGRDFDSPDFGLPRGQSVQNFANGGRPPVGRASIVGERGPELFVPDRAGTIIPNNQLGGMAGAMNVIVNVDASGSSVEGDEQQGRELGRVISAAVQSELIQQKRPGGLLA